MKEITTLNQSISDSNLDFQRMRNTLTFDKSGSSRKERQNDDLDNILDDYAMFKDP